MALQSFFQKVVEIKNEKKISIKKPFVTPNFWCRNFFRMYHFWFLNYLSPDIPYPLLKRSRNGPKQAIDMEWKKNKVCMGNTCKKRQLLGPKKCMDYYRFFSRKFVWFGIFWVRVRNIDIWGIFPTQFSSLDTNLLSKLQILIKYEI